ncbi:MAG: hypothetical protein J2P21_31500, partial [Chloracidobacterium sp.]|nr:hypothetical protein [Chloracidobacterium sp.]
MSKHLRILLGVIVLALMSANFGLYVYSVSLPKKGSYSGISANWSYGQDEPRVTEVNREVLSADIQAGDQLIAIDGVKIRDNPAVLLGRDDDPPGSNYKLTIRRAGALHDVMVRTVPNKERVRFDPSYYI